MRGRKVRGRDLSSSLVGLQGFISGGLALVTKGKLGEITVIISLPRFRLAKFTNRDI